MDTKTPDIAIIGCGPAAIVTALKLKNLGYHVLVFGSPRKHSVTEGISERVYQSLKNLPLDNALLQISKPVQRYARWNNLNSKANTERLIDRVQFDRSLIKDLQIAEVEFCNETIIKLQLKKDIWQIKTRSGSNYQAYFIVESRGRSAPLRSSPLEKTDYIRGPETLSLGQNWFSKNAAFKTAFSQVASYEDGWMWLASHGNGRVFAQCSICADPNMVPAKEGIQSFILNLFEAHSGTPSLLKKAETIGDSMARSSTPILVNNPINSKLIRIGDAAMAVDPLSGNGIFQSLSSALTAPAIINTLLKKQEDSDLAIQFYCDRLQHLFFRFSRIGRDFYQLESQWENSHFWKERSQWPDQKMAHSIGNKIIGKEIRPVLNQGFIEAKEVVITSDQPLGIWKIDGQLATAFLKKQL